MEKSVKFVGVSILDLLAVMFIGLKITGEIDWSWWWVLAPLWGQFVLYGVVASVVFGLLVLAKMLSKS